MTSFLTSADIDKAVNAFLQKFHPSRSIPIPVEEIIETEIGAAITTIRGLMDELSIDGFFSNTFDELFIDYHIFMNRTPRARFTFAHELGHFWLHYDYVTGQEIPSTQFWKQMKMEQQNQDHSRFEVQANMFGAQLLMPKKEILREFSRIKKAYEIKAKQTFPDAVIAPYVAKEVAKIFMVSEESAAYRLKDFFK
ncbi:ImmA/IrrE family metallo-endopeptidase [Bdellovibrionota bacterium FG-2]